MSITSQHGHIIANFRYDQTLGEPGLGCCRLKFHLHYSTQAWPDERHEFRNAKAEIGVRGGIDSHFHFLGIAEPDKPALIRTSSKTVDSSLFFNLTLNFHQISAIEDLRNGNGLYFKLKLLGESYDANGVFAVAQEELAFEVNQKRWLDILKSIKYGEFLLFEVPIPSSKQSKELKSAVDLLNQGRNHFLRGNYDDTVATCRKALESISKGLSQVEIQSEAKKQFKNNDREMTMDQRSLFIREAVKHYSHLAHHVSDSGSTFSFGRKDANLVLSCTAALLSFAMQAFFEQAQ